MPPTDTASHRDPAAARAGAILTIDLDAIAANHRRLRAELDGTECAAVVKADAYGLGMARVAPALARAGARTFFVAQLGEAIELGEVLRAAGHEGAIYVLNGLAGAPAEEFQAHGVTPVLNSLGDVDAWRDAARRAGRALPAARHVDTGMSRLGLPRDELDALADDPGRLEGIGLDMVMGHLACAEEPDHPLNTAQLAAFRAARARLPAARASFANSSGIFLGPDYRFDLPARQNPPGARD
jgi:alanine racemase